jgi:hypothetical protein
LKVYKPNHEKNIFLKKTFIYFPFYITLSSFFVPLFGLFNFPIINHLFLFLTFFLAFLSFNVKLKLPLYFYFFTTLYIILLFLHFFIKSSLDVFGYLQSFFYFICFYLIFKSHDSLISNDFLLRCFKSIIFFFFITLFIELLINIFGFEDSLFLYLSSDQSFGKQYQKIPSRYINELFGINLSSLNSIFLGPQSGSILAILCLLYFNLFDKLSLNRSLVFSFLSLILLIVSFTMTAFSALIIFVLIFIFFSRNSYINSIYSKFSFILILLLFSSSIIANVFFVLQDPLILEIYLFKWSDPVYELLNFDLNYLFFGIESKKDLSSVAISWEFGLIQIVYLSGILPVLFWLFIYGYAFFKFIKIRRNFCIKFNFYFLDSYAIIRYAFFVFSVSIFSLIHYLSIISFGYFQFLGFILAIYFYLSDKFSTQ